MRAFDRGCRTRSTLLLLIVLLFCVQHVLAQAPPPQERIRRPQTIAPLYAVRERVPDPPLLASLSRSALPRRPQHSWVSDSKTASFSPPLKSYRQPVNFNLLLPPSSGKVPSWTKDADRDRAIPDRGFVPSAFATTYPATDQGTINLFTDPQDFARHLPGIGPIVDRVLKQSEAHPRLTRVIKSIQPQF